VGRWLAGATARAGYRVLLEDVMPANLHHAREALRQSLGAEALPAVAFVSTIEDAVRGADMVIDCVPDELESKLEIFCLVDRMAPPRTVLATPTTRLSITDLAACTYRASQCVAIVAEAGTLVDGAHRELLLRGTRQTAPETIRMMQEFWERLGFAPHYETELDSGS
jgi:3-hydroxybutyryl-CoA dehydrogenase